MKPIVKHINDKWCSYISDKYKPLIELYVKKSDGYEDYKIMYFILLESRSITKELFIEILNKLDFVDIERLRWKKILTESFLSYDTDFVNHLLSSINLSDNILQYVSEYSSIPLNDDETYTQSYNKECLILNNKLLSGEMTEDEFINQYDSKESMTNMLVKYCVKHTNGYTIFCNVNLEVQDKTFLNFDFLVKHKLEIAPVFVGFFKMTDEQIDEYVNLNNMEFFCHNVNIPLRKVINVYNKYEPLLSRIQKIFYQTAMLLYRNDFDLDILGELVDEHIKKINNTSDPRVVDDNVSLIKYEIERHIMDESYHKVEYNKFYEKYAKEHIAALKIQNCMRACFENPYNPIGRRYIMKQFDKIYDEFNYILD